MRMRKLSYVSVLSLAAAGLLAACGAKDDDAADGSATDGGADTKPAGDAGDAAATDSSTDVTVTPTKFTAIMIVDKETNCTATNGPGADIDAVELRTSAGVTIGVGKTGSAAFGAGPTGSTPCTDAQCSGAKCKYSDPLLKSRIEGKRDGKVNKDTEDVGYFSLNTGIATLQIGDADGAGAAKEITTDMQIKVWEVDQVYLKDASAFAGCTCLPEKYEVWALVTQGNNTGAVKLTATNVETDNAGTCGAVVAATGCGTTVFTFPSI